VSLASGRPRVSRLSPFSRRNGHAVGEAEAVQYGTQRADVDAEQDAQARLVEQARVQIGADSLGVIVFDHEVEATGVGQWTIRPGAEPHEVAVQVDDPVVRCAVGDAASTVPDRQGGFIAKTVQVPGGLGGEARVQLDARYVVSAEAMAEQRGVVVGGGADLQHARTVEDVEQLQHANHQTGHG
jgi:hypothetical protein